MNPAQNEGERLRTGVRGHDELGDLTMHTGLQRRNVGARPASTAAALEAENGCILGSRCQSTKISACDGGRASRPSSRAGRPVSIIASCQLELREPTPYRTVNASQSGPRRSAMENKPAQNIQDTFLNTARKERSNITIYLLSGVKLTGRIRSFDKYSVVLETNNEEQLIFKHAISTVVMSRTVHVERHY